MDLVKLGWRLDRYNYNSILLAKRSLQGRAFHWYLKECHGIAYWKTFKLEFLTNFASFEDKFQQYFKKYTTDMIVSADSQKISSGIIESLN